LVEALAGVPLLAIVGVKVALTLATDNRYG